VKDFLVRFLASAGFVSYLPARLTGFRKFTGSGLAGTLVALALTPFLPQNQLPFAIFLALFFPVSVFIAGLAEKSFASHDDPRIVIDEVIGYWTAIAFLPRDPFTLAVAFILFRALDTLKPWPIKAAETRFNGGFAIIMDDLLAGLAANLLTRLALIIFR
jgi:phosphatidylglycerophosphatase A